MREILFRGKRVDNGEWVYGSLLPLTIENKPRYFIIPNGADARKSRRLGDLQVEVNPETIGIFLELTDKKGKFVYDGDIVKLYVSRKSRSNWWQETNKNHGKTGDFIYQRVKFEFECGTRLIDLIGINGNISQFQREEIEQPRGKERELQCVDDINFEWNEDVEVFGNIYDDLEGISKKYDML